MSETPEVKFRLKETLNLASTALIGLFFLLLGIADLLYVNKTGLTAFYYGRGIATLLFGIAVILYPFAKETPGLKLGAIALTVIAAYFITMTYLFEVFYLNLTDTAAALVDFILFAFFIRLYIPLAMKIEDKFHRTILDVIFGGVLLFYLLGVLVFPFSPSFSAPSNQLTLNGLVTKFVTFGAVNLTFLLLPTAILVVVLRVRFIGGFIGLILATRNKELSIARIDVLKKFVSYLFLVVLFIIFSYSAHYLYVNARANARAKIATIAYILYDLGFFILVTYELAEGLYKRCE